MLFHIIIIIFFFILGILLNNTRIRFGNKLYLFITFSILFILSAFRSVNIGNDTWDYFLMYRKFGSLDSIRYINSYIEIGYIALNKVLYSISPSTLLLTTVTSAFILGVFIKYIYDNSKIIWLSVLLFINLRTFYFTLSGIRQSIALAIVLISYKFVKERKLFPFVALVLIASTFHLTALAFLLIYPLSKLDYNRKVMTAYILVSSFLFVFFDHFISIVLRIFPKYQVYLTSSYFENIRLASIIDFLVALSIFIFGYFLRRKNKKSTSEEIRRNRKVDNQRRSIEEKNILLHIMSLAVTVTFIAINVSIVKRAGMYFSAFSIIFIPNVIYKIKERNLKIILLYLVIILTFAYNMIVLVYRPEWQHVYPYEFIWSNAQ